MVAQIPPPLMDVPMPVRKALLVDRESKVVNQLIHGEYELNNTSWSKLQKKYYMLVEIKYILLVKEKEDPQVPSTDERRKKLIRLEPAALTSHSKSVNE